MLQIKTDLYRYVHYTSNVAVCNYQELIGCDVSFMVVLISERHGGCFEIAPGYRGKGMASALLKRVCEDAKKEGFQFVEGYPRLLEEYDPYDYTGPIHLFEKAGFEEMARQEGVAVMRKEL